MIKAIPYQYLNEDQSKRVLEWRNDERVRKWMKNSAIIAYEDHISFIKTLIVNKRKKYFLVVEDGVEIGIINFVYIDSLTVEGGVLKNPSVKKPVGNILMECLERETVKHGYSSVLLEVQISNQRAQNLYSRIGYKIIDRRNNYLVFRKDSIKSTFIIAELSANHNQNLTLAKKTIVAAAAAGSDAVKIQTYTADTITIDCNNEYFRINQDTLWDGKILYNLYKEAYTPWEWHDELRDLAESLGLIFFSTPFDKTAVDFLEEKHVPLYKIASFEITDIPLIEYTASKGKPMIISTGIADAADIQLAVDTCKKVGNTDITLLQCTSSYPAPVEEANLHMIRNLAETFGVKSGLSDHTMDTSVVIAAVALGAVMIEKHFILDRSAGGPDSVFSMEPSEFKKMVEDIRIVERALGSINYSLTERKKKNRKFSRSLFVVEDIPAGGTITEKNVRSIRPGDGMHPKYLSEIIGCKALSDLKRGFPLKLNNISIDKN